MDATAAIALSALTAASARLQASASNLANMDDGAFPSGSTATAPAPFVPTRVETVSLGSGGVQAQLLAGPPGVGVDPASELVEQMLATQQYRASAALIAADDKLKKSTIELLG